MPTLAGGFCECATSAMACSKTSHIARNVMSPPTIGTTELPASHGGTPAKALWPMAVPSPHGRPPPSSVPGSGDVKSNSHGDGCDGTRTAL